MNSSIALVRGDASLGRDGLRVLCSDVCLSCPCNLPHFCRYHHCDRHLGRDPHQYCLAEEVVGCFLLDQLSFLYSVGS